MARFDVFKLDGAVHHVVDVQADILEALRTRVVVPLVPASSAHHEAMPRLRPRLRIGDKDYILNVSEIAAVPCPILGECVANLEGQRDVIVDAVDFLMQGF